jgi:hypothetical protein
LRRAHLTQPALYRAEPRSGLIENQVPDFTSRNPRRPSAIPATASLSRRAHLTQPALYRAEPRSGLIENRVPDFASRKSGRRHGFRFVMKDADLSLEYRRSTAKSHTNKLGKSLKPTYPCSWRFAITNAGACA